MPNPADTDTETGREFITGLIVGAVLGTGLALILSTPEGKHLKSKLKEKARVILDTFSIDDPPSETNNQLTNPEVSPHIRSLQSRGRKIARRFLNVKK